MKSLLLWLPIFLGILCNASTAYALRISYTATIPRSVSAQGYVDARVNITDLFASEASQLTATEIQSRLEIYMPQISDSRLPYLGDGSHGFYATYEGDLTSESNATTGNVDLEFAVRIHEDTDNFQQLMNDYEDTLTLAMSFDAGEQGSVTGDDTDFTRDTSVANQAPNSLTTRGLHHAIRVDWVSLENIAYTSGDEKAPAGSVIVAVPQSANGQTIPTYIFGGSESDTASTSCYYDSSLVDTPTSCIVCPDSEDHYINLSELTEIAGVIVTQSSDLTKNSLTLSPLEPGIPYAVFGYHLPDGVVRSSCLSATPIETSTMSELLGEPAATATDAALDLWGLLGLFTILAIHRRNH